MEAEFLWSLYGSLSLSRTENYQIDEFDWLNIESGLEFSHLDQ